MVGKRLILLCLSCPVISTSLSFLANAIMPIVETITESPNKKKKIRVVEVEGTPFERGYQHGQQCREDIRRYTEARIDLARQKKWSGHDLTREQVLQIANQCIPSHEAYAPDLMEELRGVSEATDLSLEELIIVGGFTDFVDVLYNAFPRDNDDNVNEEKKNDRIPIDDCTAFLVPDQMAVDGMGFFGQTWDMHKSSLPFVILLHIKDPRAESLVFTTAGCLGQIGMNEHGVCIGINNLVAKDGQIGVTWNFVVRKALQQKTATDALRCVTEAKLAGAHNFQIFDKSGIGYNVEAMSTRYVVTPLKETPISHTNHCLLSETLKVAQKRPEELQICSEERLELANDLLRENNAPISIGNLIALTRTPPILTYPEPPFDTASCGAAIMQPKSLTFWALDGLPDQNEYEEFSLAHNNK